MELKFPLYGLRRNYQGLHEENFVYTEEQIKKYDPEVLDYPFDKPGCFQWTDAYPRWGNDTADVIKLHNEKELRQFLEGAFNYTQDDLDYYYDTDEENQKDENGEFGDWRDVYYWINSPWNYYYGLPNSPEGDTDENPTMKYILENFDFNKNPKTKNYENVYETNE